MMPRGGSGPTITQVAEEAGVSRATVSRVLNGRSTVAADIGERVRQAAERLQYRPNLTARNLSTGRTMTIALVVPDLGNPMFQTILRGLQQAAERDGYSVLVAEAGDVRREAEVVREARNRCDAVVVASPRTDDETLRELLSQVAPVVLINRRTTVPDVATIRVDYAQGMSLLIEHLEAYGHRDFLFLSGPEGSVANRIRRQALESASMTVPGARLRTLDCGSSMSAGYQAADGALASGATALLAFNDLVAFGVLARLNEIGVNVPGDVSVTGFDGIELSRFAVPSLTTVGQRQRDIGAEAWGLLLRRITAGAEGGGMLTGMSEPDLVLPPQLVVGDSTGRVPPARVLGADHAAPGAPASVDGALGRRLGWELDGEEWTLRLGDRLVAAQASGAAMTPVHSPRPHLHPVRTLAGIAMTGTNPTDHRHHYGVSMCSPDVNGTTYWGGRTYVEGRGSTLLANHGRQVLGAADVEAGGRDLVQPVRWHGHDGRDLLLEQRRLCAFLLPEDEGWALRWRSRLQADAEPVTFASPANRGRVGAGYGGFFWRLPDADETRVLVEEGEGEAAANGSRGAYVIIQRRHGDAWTSLILVQDEQAQGRLDPWFVRATDYVGAGTSLAWDHPYSLPLGGSVEFDVVAGVLDRAADAGDVARLLAACPAPREDPAAEGSR